jgi:phenylacetate-CoA ligase
MRILKYPFSFLHHYRTWMAEESLDADRMRRLQERKLDMMLKAARETRHYRRLVPGNLDGEGFLSDTTCLPITEKKYLRDAPETFVSGGRDVRTLGFAQTSGSTGLPTRIYLDADVAWYRQAVRYATDVSFGRSPFDLLARVHAHDYDRGSLMETKVLFPKVFLPISNPPEENFRMLIKRKPAMLRGYPSTLSILARLNDAAGRPLRFKSVVSVAELLSDDTRKAIGDSFSCPVYTDYGSMEMSSIARECGEHSLHVDSHACMVEIVGRDGKPVRGGEGDVVVTQMFSSVMPILRFRIGDRARWGRECACGRQTPVLEGFMGRKDDYIVLPSGRVRSGKNFYLELSLLSHFFEYQIVQEEPGRIVFRHVPVGGRLPDAVRAKIKEHIISQCLGERMDVEFEQVARVPRGRTGKLRVVSSKVPLHDAV